MKKIMALILLFIMIISSANVYAMPDKNKILTKQDVITIAKNKLGDIKYYEMNAQYREFTNKGGVWILFYTDKKDGFQNIEVTIDAKNGEIIRYNLLKEKSGDKNINKDEALKIAKGFLSKVKPLNLNKYVMDKNLYNEETPTSYNFKWRREENGITFLYDIIDVTVDKKTGDVINYTYNWTDGSLPELKNVVDMNEALKLYKEFLKPQLVYMTLYNKNKGETKLIYKPSQYMINAQNRDFIDIYGNKINLKPSAITNITLDKLTRNESRSVSKEEALKIASKYVNNDMMLKSTSYFEKYAGLDINVWMFRWNKKDGVGYTHVAVNANTGNIVDIVSSTKFDTDITISRETALKLAKDFVNKKFKNIVPYLTISDDNNNNNPGGKIYGYHFIFPMKQYNIPFINNGVTIDVDGKGNISAYSYKNYDIALPFPSNILTQDEVMKMYLNAEDFGLKYFKPEGKNIMLVYSVNEPLYNNIDAITGEKLRTY